MRELSLFTGAGGGLLGTKLLGWQHIGYVEFNQYCQQVIRQRIEDGFIDRAPIFTDVREFLQSGAAEQYRGFADVVTAGFPCQPHSRIGKRAGKDDERDLWPETYSTIRVVRPRFVLLENNPGILDAEYGARVSGDLASIGYVGHQICLSARRLGAHHGRERVWWLATDTNAHSDGLQGWNNITSGWEAESRSIPSLVQSSSWPEISDPYAHGGLDGVADRVERTKSIGNGQVPAVVAAAWRLLSA